MKRFLLLIVLCMINLCTMAADMQVESFEVNMQDMDARVNAPKIDQNGYKAALIKIETTEKAFGFDVGQLGIVDTEFDHIAEVWVYVPFGVVHLKIMHQELGIIDYKFPIPIKEATVYNMKLTTAKITQIKHEQAKGEYLQLQVTPIDADAELIIDNDPPLAIVNGEIGPLLTFGEHTITIKSKLYKEHSETITMGSDGVVKSIALLPNFGYLEVTPNVESQVTINGFDMGKTPYKSGRLKLGDYTVELSAPNYGTYSAQHTLSEGGKSVKISPTLVSYLTKIDIIVPLEEAQIFVNKVAKGNGSWSGELMPGSYVIETVCDGYHSTLDNIKVERGVYQAIWLEKPTPMYGSLNVSAQQIGVEVFIDGKVVGKAPKIFSDILAGKHKVKFAKSGYNPVEAEITISEGEIYDYSLPSMVAVTAPAATPTVVSAATDISSGSVVDNDDTAEKRFKNADYEALGKPVNLKIPYGYTRIEHGGVCCDCDHLAKIEIPNSVTTIGQYAFAKCDNLTSVTIPNSVKSYPLRQLHIAK